ncbi:hypothetical protein BU26DRAFT_571662 [Trematosphaeria pertusa]|uniref:Uncharacterized protein n=1 Tax=Trematosphaeria pertusa TaxID=390896 RepID=A0A6A6HTS1_9PLEO|nr:uncharacterized protein BU26DRAFT_571662 [Trematosphaeria pertusa]KAF2241506.1 hypothetical protein BU26DRAFT_571662 [Trematosphaeria pertusa]
MWTIGPVVASTLAWRNSTTVALVKESFKEDHHAHDSDLSQEQDKGQVRNVQHAIDYDYAYHPAKRKLINIEVSNNGHPTNLTKDTMVSIITTTVTDTEKLRKLMIATNT